MLNPFSKREDNLRINWSNTFENRCADMLRMLPHVHKSRISSVGAAKQVDLFVTKRRACFIEIIHCNSRRIQSQVGILFELSAAVTKVVNIDSFGEVTAH